MKPSLHFRPLRPAVAADGATTLDLLITVSAPALSPERQARPRQPLNLALVIDRSGSMSGSKLSYARKAARFLVGELSERDRLAIVTFDDEVEVLVPSQPVRNPQLFIRAINTIHSGGGTALFDGWLGGATEVAQQLDPAALNRVLLLSDGDANVGLIDSDGIASKVAGLSQLGISTSAFGLGSGFDEDLMGAVAAAGDGTLAHIESPAQLADLYASELDGLASTLGKRVSIGIRAKRDVQLIDVINDLEPTSAGNLQLPNLRHGQELNIAARFQLPPWQPNREIVSVRLAWRQPGSQQRQSFVEHLVLPVMATAELQGMKPDPLVIEQFELVLANRQRRQAIEELDRGNLRAARAHLEAIDQRLSLLPQSEAIQRERLLLEEKKALLDQNRNLSRKRMRRESMRSSMSVWEPDSELSEQEMLALLGFSEEEPGEEEETNEPFNKGMIANEDLRLSDIPDPDAEHPHSVVVFGHTFNGYDVAGGMEECAEISRHIFDRPNSSLTELRCALFFSCRAARHTGADLDTKNNEYLRKLLRLIRQKVITGDLQ
jgi:Ca-activated chloride channel family protein